jgi:TRAP-type mannitol/chloroaromatic compound transport system permease small subunit
MDKLRTFMMAVEKTNIFVGKMMAYVSLVCVAVISFEVFMRYAFNLPTNWGHELMYSLFAMYYVTVVGVAHYGRPRAGDVIYAKQSRRTQAVMDLFSGALFYIFVLVYIYTSWNFYWSSQTMSAGNTFLGIEMIGEASFTDWGPPLYPVKFLMPFGVLPCCRASSGRSGRHVAFTGGN